MPKKQETTTAEAPTFDSVKALKRIGTLQEVLKNEPHSRLEDALEDYLDAVTDADLDPSKDNISAVNRFLGTIKAHAEKASKKQQVTVYLDAIPQRVGGPGAKSAATIAREAEEARLLEALPTMTGTDLMTALHAIHFGARVSPKTGTYKPLNDYTTDIITSMAEANLKEASTEE